MSQFCGSGLRSRSNVTSAAGAIDVPASSVQPNVASAVVLDLVFIVAPFSVLYRSRRLLSEAGHAPQQPPRVRAEIGARVQRAAVVPHQEVAGTPDVLVDELAPLL